MKLHFIEYTEAMKDLNVSNTPLMSVFVSFGKGLNLNKYNGKKTIEAAQAHINKVNTAAGREIALYAGRLIPTGIAS